MSLPETPSHGKKPVVSKSFPLDQSIFLLPVSPLWKSPMKSHEIHRELM